MKFTFSKDCNIYPGQTLWGVIVASLSTYGGVRKLIVDHVDFGCDIVVFSVDQPCQYVYCSFDEMQEYVFETEAEAYYAAETIDFTNGFGLWDYDENYF